MINERDKKKVMKDTKHVMPKNFKMNDRTQNKSKGVDLDKGLSISKKEKSRAVACDYVIDCNKRQYLGHEPEMTE